MAKENLTKNVDIDITVREIDFVTRFARNWDALREIMGIMRPIKKTAGTKLTSKRAKVVLANGAVGEGEEIPYSHATVEEIEYNTIAIKKYAKAVSIEAIDAKDYNNAVQRTDDEFLNELQSVVMDEFYTYLQTGTLKSTEGSFQMALAMAQGRVIDKWKKMHKGITGIVGFCNVLDAYSYLGAANITVQNQFGMNYIENFLGYNKLFLTSEIPQGKVIATPVDNIVLYYVDPADSQFARAGLSYTTDGETNLIGFHVQGNYNTAVSESFALMGMTLFAEYLDGISVVTFGQGGGANLASLKVGTLTLTPTFDPDTITYTAATTTATSKITAVAEFADATIEIKNGTTVIENGGNASWSAGENTLTVKVTNDSVDKTYTVTVTKS
jgi:hypothetical protein